MHMESPMRKKCSLCLQNVAGTASILRKNTSQLGNQWSFLAKFSHQTQLFAFLSTFSCFFLSGPRSCVFFFARPKGHQKRSWSWENPKTPNTHTFHRFHNNNKQQLLSILREETQVKFREAWLNVQFWVGQSLFYFSISPLQLIIVPAVSFTEGSVTFQSFCFSLEGTT